MSSSSSAKKEDLPQAKRLELIADMVCMKGVSKVGLAKTLHYLSSHGLLSDALTSSPSGTKPYMRQIVRAIDQTASRPTPYGQILQQLHMQSMSGERVTIHYVHPAALLFYMCSVNEEFYTLLKEIAQKYASKLSMLLYVDEVNPGNPQRPDPQKLLQAFYWTIVEMPVWWSRRKNSWFIFAIIRSTLVHALAGDMSELMKEILLLLWPEVGLSLENGISLEHAGDSIVISFVFAGILADEKGLKEVFDIAGQAGSIPCVLNCFNVRNRWCRLTEGQQHFWDPDLSLRKPTTKEHIDIIVQRIQEAKPTSKYAQDKWRAATGINFCQTGILFCTYLMANVVNPCIHYVRDWMHTYCSNGVAGTHISMVIQAMAELDIDIDIPRQYAASFTVPRSSRRYSDLFFKSELVASDNVRHFASDVLGMVFFLMAFLLDKIAPRGLLLSTVDCFRKLFRIICTLRRGIMDAGTRDRLKALIVDHNRQFIRLYGNTNCKIKFHHTEHVPDDNYRLDEKVFSTFTTERKNKDVLGIVNASDKSIERTATCTFLHSEINAMVDSTTFARHSFLAGSPTCFMAEGKKVWTSKEATLPGGLMHTGDMVFLKSGAIGQIQSFFDIEGTDEHLVSHIEVHKPLEEPMRFNIAVAEVVFTSTSDIVEPVYWHISPKGFIVAIVPEYC